MTSIDPSMVDENQLANFHWYCWEERLKIKKPTKLKVTKLEVSEDIFPQSWETFLRSYIFVSFQQITFKLGIFTNFKACISHLLVPSKSWKNRGRFKYLVILCYHPHASATAKTQVIVSVAPQEPQVSSTTWRTKLSLGLL